jgi:hypothetical protein
MVKSSFPVTPAIVALDFVLQVGMKVFEVLVRKVIRFIGQNNPGHRGGIGTEESCPSTIGCMNGERAEADGHGVD